MDGCAHHVYRCSCTHLYVESTILGATDLPRIALASVFASKNHVDVLSAQMMIDKTHNLYKINIEMIFIIELFK